MQHKQLIVSTQSFTPTKNYLGLIRRSTARARRSRLTLLPLKKTKQPSIVTLDEKRTQPSILLASGNPENVTIVI